jgi:hypothetical protein
VAVEVEQIRSNLVALISRLRSRSYRDSPAITGQLTGARAPLSVGSLAPDLSRLSRQKVPKQLHRIGIQSVGYSNKFNHINAAFAAFIFRNKRLRPAKLFGQLMLTNARLVSHCDKDFEQPSVFRGFKGLLHAPPGERIGGEQFDPGTGLSQNRIILTEIWHVGSTVEAGAGLRRQRKRIGDVDHREQSNMLDAVEIQAVDAVRNAHSQDSSLREQALGHRFLAELLSLMWRLGRRDIEVLKSEVDRAGLRHRP